MVLAKKIPQITKEFLMSKIDSWMVYRNEIPDMEIGMAIRSPLRVDNSPSFLLKVCSNNELKHFDFAREEFRGDCIDFICQKYQINYDKALQKVAKDFGILEGENNYKEIIKDFTKPVLDIKRNCLIQVEARKWINDDLNYWGNYLVPAKKVKDAEIYPVKNLFLNRKQVFIKQGELVYAYRRPTGFKIYMPERPKGEKWLSNIPITDVMYTENLSKDYNSLVIPSLKCLLMCTEIYPYCCHIQNESIGALNTQTASIISSNSKRVFYGGNNDLPGKEASYKITNKYLWNHLNPPDDKPKDWSDWAKKEQSLKSIEQHFKNKGLI